MSTAKKIAQAGSPVAQSHIRAAQHSIFGLADALQAPD
jgi:hypothetical protein